MSQEYAQYRRAADEAALRFYLDHGVDEALLDEAPDRFALPSPATASPSRITVTAQPAAAQPPLGQVDGVAQAVELARGAQTLEELRAAIAEFDGLALKKTATNLVFADGNPRAHVMLVGEAPGADEDRQGKPFVGVSGQLLDRILAATGLSRAQDDLAKSVYISNIINWRPPGNRTPTPAETAVSLPFIERHIQLAAPKILIFCGGVSAKTLLGSDSAVSRLRKSWHDYRPLTPALRDMDASTAPIPAIATYHPAYLLRTPAQKKAIWADMLMVLDRMRTLSDVL